MEEWERTCGLISRWMTFCALRNFNASPTHTNQPLPSDKERKRLTKLTQKVSYDSLVQSALLGMRIKDFSGRAGRGGMMWEKSLVRGGEDREFPSLADVD